MPKPIQAMMSYLIAILIAFAVMAFEKHSRGAGSTSATLKKEKATASVASQKLK